MKKILLLSITIFIVILTFGQKESSNLSSDSSSNSSRASQRSVSTAILDINQVKALYMNRGNMFWDGVSKAKYEVPKGSGKTPTFAGGLWLSALDEKDSIHIAVAKYNMNNKYDYFSGPLRATGSNKGTTDSTYAKNFQRIWRITRWEILNHQENYNNSDYTMPEDIKNWPAHGNESDGYAKNLAPFIDVDVNGIYEPEKGDYPDIKGDMSLYWIFNDNLAEHTETGGRALGVEVHMQAYAYTCDTVTGVNAVINYTTFLEYTIINRSDTAYHNFSPTFWSDTDLGGYADDYMATNVGLNTMYFYNGDDTDGDGTGNTYGDNPPAFLISFLDGPLAKLSEGIDNDNDGTIDEEGEKTLLYSVRNYSPIGSGHPSSGPETPSNYYNFMHRKWNDSLDMVYGGTGYSSEPDTCVKARFLFPGNTDPWNNGTDGIDPDYPYTGGWSEENENNPPGDRRGIMISGPFDFNPGDELKFTIAFVWSRGDNGAMSSVTKGFEDVAKIIELYNNNELSGCGLENVSIKEIKSNNTIEIYPNPAQDHIIIKGAEANAKYQIVDIQGQIVKQGIYANKSLSIKGLQKGIYIVKVISKGQLKVKKLIIE